MLLRLYSYQNDCQLPGLTSDFLDYPIEKDVFISIVEYMWGVVSSEICIVGRHKSIPMTV